jgi:hypothetical protein
MVYGIMLSFLIPCDFSITTINQLNTSGNLIIVVTADFSNLLQ